MRRRYENTGLDVYDMRKPCGPYPLCSDMGPLTNFLNAASTKDELGVTGVTWEPCNNQVCSAIRELFAMQVHVR